MVCLGRHNRLISSPMLLLVPLVFSAVRLHSLQDPTTSHLQPILPRAKRNYIGISSVVK
jgi:hypothetical protein